MTDIFKSADWAREAAAKRVWVDWTKVDLPLPPGAQVEYGFVRLRLDEAERLFGGPAGGSMKDA